jgi:hypothetical protein
MAYLSGIDEFYTFLRTLKEDECPLFIHTGIYEHDIFSETHDLDQDVVAFGNPLIVKRKDSKLNIYRKKITETDIINIKNYIDEQTENVTERRSYFYEGANFNKDKTILRVCWGS